VRGSVGRSLPGLPDSRLSRDVLSSPPPGRRRPRCVASAYAVSLSCCSLYHIAGFSATKEASTCVVGCSSLRSLQAQSRAPSMASDAPIPWLDIRENSVLLHCTWHASSLVHAPQQSEHACSTVVCPCYGMLVPRAHGIPGRSSRHGHHRAYLDRVRLLTWRRDSTFNTENRRTDESHRGT
jgi:hypothetical protein